MATAILNSVDIQCPECLVSGRVHYVFDTAHQYRSVIRLVDGVIKTNWKEAEEYDKFDIDRDSEYKCFACFGDLDEDEVVEHNKRLLLISSLSGLAADSEKVVG